MNSAYEEIRNQLWWLPADAAEIDGGELYAQLKAPTRIRNASSGEVRYRWNETGSMDHYRHAHTYDHLVGLNYLIPRVIVCW